MVESSGSKTLTARQACAVESAVQQSGMQVILVVMATYLDLRDNTTCYLYMKSDKLKIFSLDIEKFAENSPIGNEFDKHNICAWTRQLNKQRQCFLKVWKALKNVLKALNLFFLSLKNYGKGFGKNDFFLLKSLYFNIWQVFTRKQHS